MTDDEIRLRQKDRLIKGYKYRLALYGKKLFAKRKESIKYIPTKELVKIILTRVWQRLHKKHQIHR